LASRDGDGAKVSALLPTATHVVSRGVGLVAGCSWDALTGSPLEGLRNLQGAHLEEFLQVTIRNVRIPSSFF
jgi:hypothetical protein